MMKKVHLTHSEAKEIMAFLFDEEACGYLTKEGLSVLRKFKKKFPDIKDEVDDTNLINGWPGFFYE